jgi:hypothetical protein
MTNPSSYDPIGHTEEAGARQDAKTTASHDLHLLCYTALYAGDDIDADLARIEASARRNNLRDGITGALVYDAGRFIQVIEGPRRCVDRLLVRISNDPRSSEVRVLFDVPIRERSTARWELRAGRLDDTPPVPEAELERFRAVYERGFRLDAAGFVELLLRLLDAPRGSQDGSGR